MEGNDVGYFHHSNNGFYPLFGATYVGVGNPLGNVARLTSLDSTISEGIFLDYNYNGAIVDEFVDILEAAQGDMIFQSQDGQGRMVAHDAPGYRTVYGSIAFGGIIDGEGINTRAVLMSRLLSFLLYIEPSIDIALIPVSQAVHRGEELEISLRLENTTNRTLNCRIYTNVILPSGQPFGGNPVAGPVTLSVPPGRVINYDYGHHIPQVAPMGTYTYIGVAEKKNDGVVDIDSFEFTVMAP